MCPFYCILYLFIYYVDSTVHLYCFFFFSSRRRHTRCSRDWSSDVCSSDLHSTDEHPTAPPYNPASCALETAKGGRQPAAPRGTLRHPRAAPLRRSTHARPAAGYLGRVPCLRLVRGRVQGCLVTMVSVVPSAHQSRTGVFQ